MAVLAMWVEAEPMAAEAVDNRHARETPSALRLSGE